MENKPITKKWWFWLIVAAGVVFWAFTWISALNGLSETTTTSANMTPAAVDPKEETPEQESKPEQEPEEMTTEDRLTAIIDSLGFDYSNLAIVPISEGYKISYNYDSGAWDETGLISGCLSDYINLCKEAYQMDDINKIELYVFCKMTDARGNEDYQKAFAISMPKENYDKYDWDNIKGAKGKYDVINEDCDLLDIHEGIKKNIDLNNIIYF